MALGCAACNGYFGLAGCGLGDDGGVPVDFVGPLAPGEYYDPTLGYEYPTSYPSVPSPSTTPSTPTVTSNPSSSSSTINWNSILSAWTNAGTSIAKAAAGANPTFQSISPNGAMTTIFGNPSSLPANISSLIPSSVGGIGIGTLLLGGAALFIVSKMFEGRR